MFTLPQQNLGAVSRAMAAGTRGGGGAGAGQRHRAVLDRGTLTVLDNEVDPTTGTIKLKASFPNDRLQLWPGAFLTVRLRVDTVRDAVTVPPVAVQRGPEGAYVYTVVGDGDLAERRAVKVGHEDQVASIVTNGPRRRRARGDRRCGAPLRQEQDADRPARHQPARAGRRPPRTRRRRPRAQPRCDVTSARRLVGGAGGGGPRHDPRREPTPPPAPPARGGAKQVSISSPFIARPIATTLLAIAVLLGGVLGYRALPLSALPQVDFPTIQITTQLPGANPDTVSTLITASLERQFGQIPGLTTMTSVLSEGTSADHAAILPRALHRQRRPGRAGRDQRLSTGTLPVTLPYPPVYSKVNPADAPIVTLALMSDAVTIDRVSDAADTLLQPKLSQIEGVGKVTVQGNMRPAIRVRVDPARLAGYGLSMEDVRTAVSAANVNGAKGGFDGPRQAIALGANDQLLSPEAYRSLVIAYRNAAPVRLSDVGSVIGGVENDRVAAAYVANGASHPAVVLDIQRQPGANIVATVDRIKQELPALQRAMPAAISLTIVTDRTETIRASVDDVQLTLLLSIVLVVLVIFAFLRSWRATLIPAVALPLSLVGTFGIMSWLGYGLDNLSLMALTVATGFVVDDAIVMIENVVRYIEQGVPPLEAAFKGASQIGFTIVSLTISLIAVFIPLLFMTGVVGRLFSEFAVTLSVSVIVSAVVSLTLTPMMCGRLLRPEQAPGRIGRITEGGFSLMLRGYRRGLTWSLRRQPLVLLIAVATLAGTIVLYVATPKGFLPAQDTGVIVAVTEAAQSVSIPRMATLQAQAADIVRQDPAVTGIVSFVGAGSINPTPNTGRLTIALRPRTQRDADATGIAARLQSRLTGIPGLTVFMQPVQDIQIGTRISRTQFQYTLIDTDAARAECVGAASARRGCQTIPESTRRRERCAERWFSHLYPRRS